MKKIIKTILLFLPIILIPVVFFGFNIVNYVQEHYAEPKVCTVESVDAKIGATGTTTGAAIKKITLSTKECGKLQIVYKSLNSSASTEYYSDKEKIKAGEKYKFYIQPLYIGEIKGVQKFESA